MIFYFLEIILVIITKRDEYWSGYLKCFLILFISYKTEFSRYFMTHDIRELQRSFFILKLNMRHKLKSSMGNRTFCLPDLVRTKHMVSGGRITEVRTKVKRGFQFDKRVNSKRKN